MNNLQESILDAMKVFIKDSTSKLNFPLVLECEIVRCSNEDEGEYEVNYLDNHFYAYGQYKGFKYNVGEVVYVLIPKGDFSKTKIIIGLEKDGIVNSEITDIEANPINLPTKNLRTIKIGDTIYEVMGSSAEAVTDVKVNGTSVVNEDKVANISVPTDTVTSNQMEMAIDTATRGLASETYVNNAVSSKADATEVSTALSGKVDKINGKGLSSNDYTNADKYIVSGVTSALADKVDKVAGKGLSTNDYDNTAKGIVDGVTSALADKADKSEIIDVKANPTGTATTDLIKLKVGNDIYNIPSGGGGGTEVEANPSGTATDELEKIRIGQTIYSLPEGGGSIDTIIPSTEYAASERNSTSSATYTVTDDMYAIAVNLSINGEASNYTQTCSITTDGEILDTMSNHRDTWSSPDRNYAVTVDSLNLGSGNDVTFSNTGTATYIVRLRGVIGLNQEVRLKEEVSNVITADNNNNSRTVTLSPDKIYMVLAFGTSGNGGTAGDINVTSTGTMTFTTLSAQSAKMICAFIVAGSSVTISFGNDSNYYSKGHIIYEVDVKKVEYATKEDLENYVVANPEDTPSDDISSIKIGDTIYSIAGGSGSGNKYTETILYSGSTSQSQYILSSDIDKFDMIGIRFGRSSNFEAYRIFPSSYLVNLIGTNKKTGNTTDDKYSFFTVYDKRTLNRADENDLHIIEVIGINAGDSVIYLPSLYSEEEREVGIWTDGKPLYQKTISNLNVTISPNDWRNVLKISDYFDDSLDYYDVVMMYTNTDNSQRQAQYWSIANGYLRCYSYVVNTSVNLLTIRYTKANDIPGSGTWTPEGQLAHHYSTSEKVVGTWIDGSSIYEITVNKGSVAPSGSLVMDRKTMLLYDVLTYLKTSTNSLLYYTNQSDIIWEVKAEDYGTDTAWNDLIISGSGGSPSIIQQDNKDTLDIPFGTVGTYTLPDTTGDKTLYTVLRMDSTQVSGDYGGLIGFMYADSQQNTPMFMIRNDNTNTIYRAVYGASWDYSTGKNGLVDHVLVLSIDSTNKIAKFFIDGESMGQAPYNNYGNLRLGARLANQSTNVGVKYIGVTDTFDSDDTIIKNTQSIINYYGV